LEEALLNPEAYIRSDQSERVSAGNE
jgi:hypothetical protein